jgi:hypothetical protein
VISIARRGVGGTLLAAAASFAAFAVQAQTVEPVTPETLARMQRQLEEMRAEQREQAQRIEVLAQEIARAAGQSPIATAPAPQASAQETSPPAGPAPETPRPETSQQAAQTVENAAMVAEHDEATAGSWGPFSPGAGFKVAKTDKGELSISGYMLMRAIDQLPASQSFTDHLGVVHKIDPRNDIQLQRIMVWLNGWVYTPKLRYTTIFWTVNSTNQVAIAGALTYRFNKAFELSAGIQRHAATYTMMGSFPYWLGTDRVMADEYFRPGMTSAIWATGEFAPKWRYMAMVGDNLSQLGINASKLTRARAVSGSIWWMPTTGEFGPRGGMGDYEQHQTLATRFAVSMTHSREDRFSQPDVTTPDNTQIRMSDSVLFFQTGALAPGVTVEKADYDMASVSAGFKLKGWALHAEGYGRWISDLRADGPVPLSKMKDTGFYVQTSYDVMPKTLQLYLSTSQIHGQFNDASEYILGANWFPFDTRNLRLNAQVMDINHSPVSSVFGYYVGGQKGTTLSVSLDMLY